MATARLPISKIREVLELGSAETEYSVREIHSQTDVSLGSVYKVLSAANEPYRRAAGQGCAISDEELLSWVYPAAEGPSGPDMAKVHYLLSGGLTRKAIHAEQYWLGSPVSCKYSRFAQLYSVWLEGVPADHFLRSEPGDQCLIRSYPLDLPVLDETLQESAPCSIFVAVLPASNFCYYDIYRTNSPHQWVDCIQRAFAHFGGVPRRLDIVSPNSLADYSELEQHFGVEVVSRKRPKGKNRLWEDVVQEAVEWAYTGLKLRPAPKVVEVREALGQIADHWNASPLPNGAGECIGNAFHELDCQHLGELPEKPFNFTYKNDVRVHPDSHVHYYGSFYSVPSAFIGRQLRLEASPGRVTIYDGSKRVAEHPHATARQRYQTLPDHLADSGDSKGRQWTLLSQAFSCGVEVAKWVMARMNEAIFPEYAFRKCQAVLSLGRRYGHSRLDSVCRLANSKGSRGWGWIRDSLQFAESQICCA